MQYLMSQFILLTGFYTHTHTHTHRDINKIHNGIGDTLAILIQWVTTFIAGFIVGFVKEPRLTLLLLAIVPFVAFSGAVFSVVSLHQEIRI